ncbi:DNA phosphorothioation system sulfurtransferase DndC [Echinicola shivajiensis]|uniref:DNA phosphorothioation system sulfurtransferase DndC n=1 Tax=Echinicola shivajiensis TaxID=1035916 RepID=UPI001BFCABE1|nr:DNA phosphorothioation system sulfurtransferase DndC [Echinicola shivajiensis]
MSNQFLEIESEITSQYLYDENVNRPWIIGFSGGKDSTLLLQLVWNALRKIPKELRNREIHVVCNNTLVENPRILTFIDRTLEKIQEAASSSDIPIIVHQTTPELEDSFWTNLIGRGYPAPINNFRWCTDRLKIKPTTKYIQSIIEKRGEAIILLGTRSDESSTRARSMKKHEKYGQDRLRKHVLPNAFVYAPIKDITTNQLWQYLMQMSPPWGGTHKELVTLYRNANSDDCPLVIDNTTPSCGNSRFGCWVCTVVKKDKSMEGLIDNGEDWMLPLVEIRNLIADYRNDPEWREEFRKNGMPGPGPYKEWVRAMLLEKILEAQYEIQQDQPEMILIKHQELVAIQLAWYRDGLFKNKVSEIFNRVYKKEIVMGEHEEKLRREEELLRKSCNGNDRDFELIADLLKLQKTKSLMKRKRGLHDDIQSRINGYLKEAKK